MAGMAEFCRLNLSNPYVRHRRHHRSYRTSGPSRPAFCSAWPTPSSIAGPDEDGYLEEPGVGLANRRLSIVGLADGKQPIGNEDRSILVVFNGEFFDYPEVKPSSKRGGIGFAPTAIRS